MNPGMHAYLKRSLAEPKLAEAAIVKVLLCRAEPRLAFHFQVITWREQSLYNKTGV